MGKRFPTIHTNTAAGASSTGRAKKKIPTTSSVSSILDAMKKDPYTVPVGDEAPMRLEGGLVDSVAVKDSRHRGK